MSYDSIGANRRFAEKHDLPFRLLSDSDHRLARAVGAARTLLPVPKRVSFLVGADGRVVKSYPKVHPKTHAAEVVADYRALVGTDEAP